IILVDKDNRIIAAENTYHEFGAFDIFSDTKLKKGIVVLKQPLEDYPLLLYGFYDTNIVAREFAKMRRETISVASVSMLLAFCCILLVASNITKRTKLVVTLSKDIAQGKFNQISQNEIGKDEIGVLAESFNQMSRQLQTLIEKEYNNRLIKAHLERETVQAKLLALQSQVNPHFMFNTLESIRLKAIAKNEVETAKMVMYISKMFRRLIDWDDDIIPLSDDIKFLTEFLYIQKYRFDDEFEYEVNVDEAAKTCLLPKLIIQPVVENACVHGVESISQNRKIKICITLENKYLHISVSDNGIGIDKPRLSEIKRMLQGGQKLTHSVGLFNVYQRLNLYYGKKFTMNIESQNGQGTKIDIVIPVRYSRRDF
ncbi:MAG: sensor histidine kinase, partial [Caulobacteraceae bacterium]